MAELTELAAPFAGPVLRLGAAPGAAVPAGAVLVVLESMKMEHVIEAPTSGAVQSFSVAVGDAVQSGDSLLRFVASEVDVEAGSTDATLAHVASADADTVRPELAELRRRVEGT